MDIRTSIVEALRSQEATLSENEIASLADLVTQRIGEQEELASLSNTLILEKLQPTLQIMVAHDHSSIENAAQYAVRVLVNQVVEDPEATIPDSFRDGQFCPYPGLVAFSENDADMFFGRRTEIQEFQNYIDRHIIVVTGPSGVGKSSFVLAGIVPYLKARYGDAAAYLIFRISTSVDLMTDFTRFLSEQIGEEPGTDSMLLREKDPPLVAYLSKLCTPIRKRVFLIIDQFEELFVGDDELHVQSRQRFLDIVLQTETQQQSFLTIVIITRENYFEHLDYTNRPRLIELIQRENIPLDALDDQQLRESIEKPIEVFNRKNGQHLHFQQGVVDLIIRSFRRPAVSLPLVQYLLRLLWTEKHHLTHFAYNSLGGLERVLDRHAQDIYKSFSDEDQPIVKAVLVALVRPGLGDEYTRKRVRKDSFFFFQSDAKQRKHLQEILQRLSDSRSRIISEQQYGEIAYIELTHEVLLRQWTFLQELIQVRKERIEERERLLPTAELWLQSLSTRGPKGDPSYLFRGDSLRRAQRYVEDARFSGDADSSIMACYTASRNYQRWNFMRNTVSAVIAVLILGAIVFVLQSQANKAREQANANATAETLAKQGQATAQARTITEQRIKLSQRLASNSQRQAKELSVTALGLASEAVLIDQNFDSTQALRDILEEPVLSVIKLQQGSVDFSPDSQFVLSVSSDGMIQLWDKTGQLRLTLEKSAEQANAMFSHNGQYIITTATSKTTRLWSITGQPLATLQGFFDPRIGTGFSSNDQRILTTQDDGSIQLWSNSGQLLATLHGSTKSGGWGIFSPDGQYVLTTFNDGKEFQLWDISGHPLIKLPNPIQGDIRLAGDVKFSPDSRRILIASTQGEAELWDVNGHHLSTMRIPAGERLHIEFSPDSQRILTSALSFPPLSNVFGTPEPSSVAGTFEQTKTIQLWDGVGSHLAALDGNYEPVLFSPDSQHILTTAGGTVYLWNIDGQPGPTLTSRTDAITSAAFSPDGQHILTAERDGVAQLWDISGQRLATLQGHTAWIADAVFSPDGRFILTGGFAGDGTARLWSAQGLPIAVIPGHIGTVDRLKFSPDSQQIFTAGGSGPARVWNVIEPPLPTLRGHIQEVNFAKFSADGRHILTGSTDGTARIWNTSGDTLAILKGHINGVATAVFGPDDQHVLTTSIDGSEALLWNMKGDLLASMDLRAGGVRAIFSADGQRILTRSINSMAQLWDLSGHVLAIFTHSDAVESIVLSPDSQRVLTASRDRTVRLWDLSGHVLATFEHPDAVDNAIFSPDGQRILSTAKDHTVRLWDLSGHVLATFEHPDAVDNAVFSPDGQRIVTTSWDHNARLWNTSGTLLATLEGHSGLIRNIIYSPDGQRILTTGDDNVARLWDFSGNILATLQHNGEVRSALFSPDGQHILTASADHMTRLWDLSGQLLAILRGHTGVVSSAVFSPDSQHVLTASADGTARQYDIKVDELLAAAACRAGRNLTGDEIRLFQVPTPLLFDYHKYQCQPAV